jgi:cell filamentation protein
VSYEAERDPYCYPGTSVLINLADLSDQLALDEFELSMFLTRADEPLPGGALDYDHYRSIHHHLFQDVYAWAGQPRTIRIAKGGNWFCYPENLEPFMSKVFARLADANHLVGLDDDTFASQAAEILAEVNAGHPFREGNGRTQLAFLKLLVLNADRTFDDTAIEPATMLGAMIESFAGRIGPLTAIIREIIR